MVDIYVKDNTPKEAFEAQELLKYSKDYYRKTGSGRPTKKDRRDIDDFYDDNKEDKKDINDDNQDHIKEDNRDE